MVNYFLSLARNAGGSSILGAITSLEYERPAESDVP